MVLTLQHPALPKFHTTRYYGVLASRSPQQRYLPDKPTITTTLRALGLPVRAPPIAPARCQQLLDCSSDWTGGDVDYGWPD